MKRKVISGILIAMGMLVGCYGFVGCQKASEEDQSGQLPGDGDGDNTENDAVTVTVFSVEPYATRIVFAGSAVIGNGAPADAEAGIELSTSVVFPAAATTREKAVPAEGGVTYNLEFTGLKLYTEYYYRTYSVSGGKTEYGTPAPVRTKDIVMELIDRSTTQTSVTFHGTVSEIVSDVEYGICYSSTYEKVESDEKQTFTPNADRSFSVTLEGLEPGVKYFCKIYAEQDGKRIYNDEIPYDFETKSPLNKPTISVAEVKKFDGRWVFVMDAKFVDGYSIGIQFAADVNFTDVQSHTLSASEELDLNGKHRWQVDKLLPSTTYYYRTFISSSSETEYGDTQSLKTDDLPFDVTVSTYDASSVTFKPGWTASVYEWNIAGYTTISYGILCSTSSSFDAQTSGVTNLEVVYEKNMTTMTITFKEVTCNGLSTATKYYYRAYYKLGDTYIYKDIKSVTTK
ncbi:MAG: hypothetical protein ACI395_06135 [Candidatus Cryptobacteroides sp.]